MRKTSLYIHIPWCIRKCPYCDFNSHTLSGDLPEINYVEALVNDFKHDLTYLPKRTISSIFIGGGTPSLFSAKAFDSLFTQLNDLVSFDPQIEITLEANPGTAEQARFKAYRELGINRLSLGIQSFNPKHLKKLGRIHDDHQAHQAIHMARNAGFQNINIDLMHSLPMQTDQEAIEDLTQALLHQPEHLSWYQLTIEPNTVFYKQQPPLPHEDITLLIEQNGFNLLNDAGYKRYEISAFCKPGREAAHNLNYWMFGDYYGIGAGAHGKMTLDDGQITRTAKFRQPKDYLQLDKQFIANKQKLTANELIFEFMLNTTRLEQSIPNHLFTEQTGLPFSEIEPLLMAAQQKKLINCSSNEWQITPFGRQFTNDLQLMFLND